MNEKELVIEPIDIRAAGMDLYAGMSAFRDEIQAEALPDDPLISLEQRVSGWQRIPQFIDIDTWVVRDAASSRLVGQGYISAPDTDENRHVAQFDIAIRPAYRRRGLARRLLAELTAVAEQGGRRLLVAESTDRVPAGAAFLERVGAQPAMSAHTNQLALAELDHDLVARWAEAGSDGFELGLWPGAYPEADMEAVVALMEVMNQQPLGDLEVEDLIWTPELVRQVEAQQLAGSRRRWTLYAREKETGNFAGFTQLHLNPQRAQIVQQGDTGVLPAYRGRGLGKWLKAAMLQKLLAEWPEARFVRTENADANAAMLRINEQLGFRPYYAHTLWQMETAQARAYLAGRDG